MSAPAGCTRRAPDQPRAQAGILDLTRWDFDSLGPVEINGAWEIHWDRLLSPENITETLPAGSFGYIEMPGFWNGRVVSGRALPGKGCATLRIQVRMNGRPGLYAMKIPHMYTAYRLWINGSFLSSNGEVGSGRYSGTPQFLPKKIVFSHGRGPLEIILQISNFHHPKGGMWSSILLGTETQIRDRQSFLSAVDFFLLGGLVIMGFYHICMFFFRRKDRASLFFGLLCLVVAVRIPFEGERVIIEWFPWISWEINEKVSYLTFFSSVFICNLYLYNLFPDIYSKLVARLSLAVGLAFCSVTLVLNADLYFYSRFPYYGVLVISLFYGIWVIIRSIARKKEGSIILAGGLFILGASAGIDILYHDRIISFGNVIGAGLFIFMFSQAAFLSLRSSNAFSSIESLSAEKARLFADSMDIISSLLLASSTRLFEFTRNVTRIAVMMARKSGMSPDEVEEIRIASLLHDIGMIGKPEAVLIGDPHAPDSVKLVVRNHPIKSIQIIAGLKELSGVKTIIAQHHERWDGSGYPSGLKGEDIVPGARIIGIVDDFVSMLGKRDFQTEEKKALITGELIRSRGILYDPNLVDMLVGLSDENNLVYVIDENHIRFARSGDTARWMFPSNVNFEMTVVMRVMNEMASRTSFDEESANIIGSGLGEVIRNAIIHGNKYDESKHVSVALSTITRESRKMIEIVVSDEGSGMDLNEYRIFKESRLKLYEITRELKSYEQSLDAGSSAQLIGAISKKLQSFLIEYYINFNKYRRLESPEATGGIGLIQVMQTFDLVEFNNLVENNEIRGLQVILGKYIQ